LEGKPFHPLEVLEDNMSIWMYVKSIFDVTKKTAGFKIGIAAVILIMGFVRQLEFFLLMLWNLLEKVAGDTKSKRR
jgi:hypothetical protein